MTLKMKLNTVTLLLLFLSPFFVRYSDCGVFNNHYEKYHIKNSMDTSHVHPLLSFMSPYGIDKINITLLSPQNNSIVNGGTNINFEFLDENGTVVTPITELYKWDESSDFESILRPLPMDDGLHILEVQVESDSGLWTEAKYHFYSDNKTPEITLKSPENGSYRPGGIDYDIWSSSYGTGSLNTIKLYDANDDSSIDVIAAGSSAIIYSINGKYGTPIGSSSTQSAPISKVENLNESISVIGLTDGKIRTFTNQYNTMIWTNNTISTPVVDITKIPFTENFTVLNSEELRSFDFDGNFNWNVSFVNNPQDYLLIEDINSDSTYEIIVINQTSYVSVINSTDGSLISGFNALTSLEDVTIQTDSLYVSTTSGTVAKYNVSSGLLNWTNLVVPAQNIYQVKCTNKGIIGSSGNGRLFLLDDVNGNIIWNIQAASTFIKHIVIDDFDKDTIEEIIILDGSTKIHNFEIVNGSENWVSKITNVNFNGVMISDLDNNTFKDITTISTNGEVFVFDPRANLPKLVPVWTNVSFEFNDEISGNITVWEKYSWDRNTNVSSPGLIPSPSGIHTLDVWVCDNASNIAHSYYQFFSVINIRLNSPTNNSYQKSGTLINITFSETPIDITYMWDSGSFSPTLTDLPIVETDHDLFIKVKDQSQNVRDFYYHFTTDDTPIQTITLLGPLNDTVVEGGENISFQFSETPFLEYYSWGGQPNSTHTSYIPIVSDSHVLKVFFTDPALNWRVVKYIFHTKIMIKMDSHINNSVIDPNSTLRFEFGEPPDYYEYQIDNMSTQSFVDNKQTLNVTFLSSSQTHTISIKANDSSNGVWNTETYVFKVKILVNITSHTDEGFAETGDILNVTFSTIPITKLFSWDGNRNSSRLSPVPSPDGWHYLDIYVGNIEGDFWSYHYDFFVDTDLIDIILISPTNNTRVNSWETITIEFSEPPDTVFYSWGNATWGSDPPIFPTQDGGHVLNVSVFDEAGNRNSLEYYWIVDDTPINMTLINTANGSKIISGTNFNISFNGEEPYIEWYFWDSNPASPVLPPVPWGNGTHTLTVNLSDGINWKTYKYIFEILDYPPSITVENENKPYISNVPITILINETLSECWHKWDNGTKVNNLEVITPPTEIDGYHNLTIFVKDLGGSTSTELFFIKIDNTPIKIEKLTPKNNSIVSGGEFVNITFDETPFSISYKWNEDQKLNNLAPIPSEPGDYNLNIKAYDEAGNLLEVNLKYHVKSPGEITQEQILLLLLGAGIIISSGGIVAYVAYVKRESMKSLINRIKGKFQPVEHD